MLKCKVEGCRFSDKHITQNHKCGTCGKYGHGQRECGNSLKIVQLLQIIENDTPHKLLIVPYKQPCSNKSIYSPQVILSFADNLRKSLTKGTYSVFGAGMGCVIFARHNGIVIEYIFLYDTDEQQIEKSHELQRFVTGYCEQIPQPIHRSPVPFSPLV